MHFKRLLVFAAIAVSLLTAKAATDTTDKGSPIDATSNSVYAALCAAGKTNYCGRVIPATEPAGSTDKGEATAMPPTRDGIYAALCAAGKSSYCGKATGSTDAGEPTNSAGCTSWGGGSGCADGSAETGAAGTGTATSGIEDPAKQQAVNDVLCKAGQRSYCTGGTTPTSGTSGGGEGWQALMPEVPTLEGDAKTACEVILCLAAGQRPDECIRPLEVFFNIVKRTLTRTISARKDFLELCPVVADNDFLKQLTSAQAQGAGRCDVRALNQNYSYSGGGGEGSEGNAYISSSMPSYCVAMANLVIDPTTGQSIYPMPVYVGLPERGGLWVDPKDYATAYASYTARVKAEDEAAIRGDGGGP